jgi:uncharacterized integral membrane protein
MTTVKIILMTIVLVVLAIFCGSNTANACKISFLWFSTPSEIPVFVSMLLSFVAGIVVMLPVMLIHGHSIKKRFNPTISDNASEAKTDCAENTQENNSTDSIDASQSEPTTEDAQKE